MANFLRRLVAKSRSSSPQKGNANSNVPATQQQPALTTLELEEEEFCWGMPASPSNASTALANHVPSNRHVKQQSYGCHGTQRADGVPPQLQMNSLSKALPNHVGHPPPSPSSNRRSPPRPSSKAHSPSGFSRRPFPQQFVAPVGFDEPGTSSQEQLLMSPALWPSSPLASSPASLTPWSQRNHSNPDSATSGSHSQRTGLNTTRLDELASTQTLATARPRSSSPRKAADAPKAGSSRSRSPAKKSSSKGGVAKTLDYLQAQCHLEGCSATILVEDTRFLVCKHQLSHSSDFFRTLFLNSHALPMEGVRHVREDEYVVQVSSLRHPPQALQFQWFLETTVPSPMLRDISDDLLETCMRLCKRFAARGLEMRCTRFIKDNVEAKPPLMALCWLNWSFKHHFHRSVQESCLPVVARLSLCQLEKHRQMLPEAVFADLLAMKLRTSYQQASTVFHTIHRMDHFHVDMPQCPRCGRQREQGRVRVQASPCHKLVGCERCMRDYQCQLGDEQTVQHMQAFWQCEHGLWPFSEKTEDCRCQTALYKANWSLGGVQQPQEDAGSASSRQNRPGTAVGTRCPSNQTLASKPSHSSRS